MRAGTHRPIEESNANRVVDRAAARSDVVARALGRDARGDVERQTGWIREQRREPAGPVGDILAIDTLNIAEAEPSAGGFGWASSAGGTAEVQCW